MKPRVCIITNPRTKAAFAPLSNLIDILSKISSYIYLITGNEGGLLIIKKGIDGNSFNYIPGRFILTRVIGYIILQIKFVYKIIIISRKTDCFLFFMGEGLLLPLLACKITRKPSVLALAASAAKIEMGKDILSKILVKMENISYCLSDRMIIYSPNLIKEWNLTKYSNKIFIAHEHIINFDKFKITKPLNERKCIVSYIGRFSREKGILSFIQAIPYILKENIDVSFQVGGNGPLKSAVEEILEEKGLHNKVSISGWIDHENLPDYLNNVKLLVMPSYTEGLPNIMLEAMACGTPVLATTVGAIPDILKDSETGFVMENNSPENIAKNIIRAINHPDLLKITKNAHKLVEIEFTYNNAVMCYLDIFNQLDKNKKQPTY